MPDPHAHAVTLDERRESVAATVAGLRSRIAELVDEHEHALIEARFEDADAATGELEDARVELGRAETALVGLERAAEEVSRERHRLDLVASLEAAERRRDAAADRCRERLAELPIAVAELQQLAAAALADESELRAAAGEALSVSHTLDHYGDPQAPAMPRFVALPNPVTAEFDQRPEFRMLANGVWHVGVPGPVKG